MEVYMEDRVFKKRMMVLGGFGGLNGVNTFMVNLLPVLDKNDVCVDLVSLYKTNKPFEFDETKYPNVGKLVNIWDDNPVLLKEQRFMEKTMFPFLSKRCNCCDSITSYTLLKKMFELMSENIYDSILINDNEYGAISAVLNHFAFSDFIKVIVYTHYFDIFLDPEEPDSSHKAIRHKNIRNAINSDRRVIVLTQLDPELINVWLNDNIDIRKIGMMLNVEDFRKYQLPDNEKEDRLLFIGRVEERVKRPKFWISVAKAVEEYGIRGTVIVPDKSHADKFIKYANKIGFTNFDIYHSLTFDEKLKISAKCKCFFSSSKYETFGYTIYENLSLMPCVVSDEPWAVLVKRELPSLNVAHGIKNIVSEVVRQVKGYNGEAVTKQYEEVLQYRNNNIVKWGEFLNEGYTFTKGTPSELTKNIEVLNKHHTLKDALSEIGRDYFSLEELDILYRSLDWSKVIQKKEGTFYGEIINKSKGNVSSLDAFF